MIKSEMISFRQENIEQRNIPQYVFLIEQANEVLRQSSRNEYHGNINNIAAAIRQVVLKNDCLEQKNDILDFFFLCEKQMNNVTKKQTKKPSKQGKPWTKIVQKNITYLKGLHNLYLKIKNIQLKRGFAKLNKKSEEIQYQDEDSIDVDPSSIEVEQDIRLKTLFFFKWCKFIEYGKSIKKLRLKQIDDLRKSLTFNQYAVKFSYFHNWRKIAKINALNKVKFNEIQLIEKKSLFNMTMKSFYGLFEIKKIEQKLCQRVKESILICSKQKFFKRSVQNSRNQKQKIIKTMTLSTILGEKQLRIQKMKYQCLFYMGEILNSQRIKSKSLSQNVKRFQQNYSILCAKSAFFCLKKEMIKTRQDTQDLNKARKQIILQAKFGQFMKRRTVETNQNILSDLLKKNKLKRGIRIFNLINTLKKRLHSSRSQQKVYQSRSLSYLQKSLQQHFDYIRMKHQTIERLAEIRIVGFLDKLRKHSFERTYLCQKFNQLALYRESQIFETLKINQKINQAKTTQNIFLKSVYDKNLKKNAFNSFHTFKKIRLSHQEYLEVIQQKIINPKQIAYAFQKICQHKQKIQASLKIFSNLERTKVRIMYEKCFYRHKQIILGTKEMQKTNKLRKLQLLFDLLKKIQQHNINLNQEIRANVIESYTKERFLNSLRLNYSIEIKKQELYYFMRQQKQAEFIANLKTKRQEQEEQFFKQITLSKFLALSLLKTKFEERRTSRETLQEKDLKLQRFLCLNKFNTFMNLLDKQRNLTILYENKIQGLHLFLAKNKLQHFIKKCSYEREHNPLITNEKIKKISIIINEESFYNKFAHQSKKNYMNRWMDWKKKSIIFQRLDQHKRIIYNEKNKTKKLQIFQLSNALNQIKSNIENERQLLLIKQQQLNDYLDYNRRKQIGRMVTKFSSVKQVQECQNHLKNSIRLKYFSKFVRNSLVTKYGKVKQFCAIKSYARNLKQKSWNGMKMMLMRLRDKQNRIKTQQQLILKIDKAMYQSRKSNKLTQTIQRFNCSMKKGGLGGIVR